MALFDANGDLDLFSVARQAAERRRREEGLRTPEEVDSLLGGALEKSLGGLAYVGKVADKTFGGRAVRGVLGGNAREALSVLPFSDSLGLTDERDVVSGTDLTNQLGLTTEGDDSFLNQAAGFGAELALDPSTYLGLGSLTKAGTLAKKAGALPSGLGKGLRGFDVAESAIRPTLQAGDRLLDSPMLSGGKTLLTDALEQQGVKAGEPLRALFGVGLPFQQPLATFGTGVRSQRVAGLLDAAGAGVASTAPVRALRAAFDPEVGGAYTRGGQLLSQEAHRPLLKAGERDIAQKVYEARQAADGLVGKDVQDPTAAFDIIRMIAEHDAALSPLNRSAKSLSDIAAAEQKILAARPLTPKEAAEFTAQRTEAAASGGLADLMTRARSRAAGKFTPQEFQELVKQGTELGDLSRQFAGMEKDFGLNASELIDAAIAYHTRSKNRLPRQAGESLPGYLRRVAQDFSVAHGSLVQREKLFSNIPGGTVQVNEWAKNPALRSMAPADRKAFFLQELTGAATPSAYKEVNDQAANLAAWVERIPEAHSRDQIDFFTTDPFADTLLRGQRFAKARAGAETVYEAAKRFARPMADLVAEGVDAVPVQDILRDLRLTATSKGGPLQQFGRTSDRIVGSRTGVGAGGVAALAVPRDIANDMLKLGRAWEMPRELSPILAGWDFLNNAFKTWVTTPFPAFHVRNMASGFFNQWRDNSFSVGSNKTAMDIIRGTGTLDAAFVGMKGRTPAELTNELIAEAAARNVAFSPDAGRASDSLIAPNSRQVERPTVAGGATGNSLLGDAARTAWEAVPKTREQLNPLKVQGVGADRDLNSLVKAGRKVQRNLDDWVQLGHYMEKRRQGFTADAAADAVKKYHNDYTMLTSTERNVMKRLIPWYSFSRRSLPPLLEDLVTQPGKVAGTIRLASGVRDPGEFVPSFIAEGASIPIPGAPEGNRRYISSFGLPIEDEALKIASSIGQGDATRGLQQLFGTFNPLLKAPAEVIFGTQLYSGRKLEDLKAFQSIEKSGLLNEENGRLLTQVLANTPASRFFTTADKFLDDRKPLWASGLNTLTGVRIADVDESKQRDIALRSLLEGELAGKPEVRTATSLYIPKDKLGLLSPDQLELYQAYQATKKKISERYKAEKAAGG